MTRRVLRSGGRNRRLLPPWLSEVLAVLHEVLFGLLIVGMFAVLALVAKGVEKL